MLAASAVQPRAENTDRAVVRAFLTLLVGEAGDKARAWETIETQWEPSFLPMALETIRLNPVHHDAIEVTALVVLTDPSGANRAYASEDVRFARYDGDRRVEDATGTIWTMDEHALTAPDGRALRRIPAQRAFWFGWHAAFPNTRLVR